MRSRKRDPICPARDRAGRRCQRWALHYAHWDGNHQSGQHWWSYVAPPRQLALDLTDAPREAAP